MTSNQHILESIGVLSLVLAMFFPLEIAFTFGSHDHTQDEMPRIRRLKRCETQRLTCASGSGYMSFIHVSVAADTTKPDHFSVCFRKETRVSASGFS